MPADAPAMPPKPKAAAIKATTRKVKAQLSMIYLLYAAGGLIGMPFRLDIEPTRITRFGSQTFRR